MDFYCAVRWETHRKNTAPAIQSRVPPSVILDIGGGCGKLFAISGSRPIAVRISPIERRMKPIPRRRRTPYMIVSHDLLIRIVYSAVPMRKTELMSMKYDPGFDSAAIYHSGVAPVR